MAVHDENKGEKKGYDLADLLPTIWPLSPFPLLIRHYSNPETQTSLILKLRLSYEMIIDYNEKFPDPDVQIVKMPEMEKGEQGEEGSVSRNSDET